MPDRTARRTRSPARAARDAITHVAEHALEVAGDALSAARDAAGAAATVANDTAAGARTRWRQREAARRRRLRRRNRVPLPNLYTLHPAYHQAIPRDLGLQAIPVAGIAGTAVEGPDQRGSDFLPLPPFRSADWVARWTRIRAAVDRLSILPPIDVVHAAGRWWVLDGHNRVAAALYTGQTEIDALVRALRLAGEPSAPAAGPLAPLVEEAATLRAVVRAGSLPEPVDGSGRGPSSDEFDPALGARPATPSSGEP